MARTFYDWNAVQIHVGEGKGFDECSQRFGFTRSAWNKAIARGKLQLPFPRTRERMHRYDWLKIQAYYDDGHSYRQTSVQFGFSSASWYKAITRGLITTRPLGMPIVQLISSPARNRSHLKIRLIKAGLLQNRCDVCGITKWREKPLNVHLDHINGVKDDNRLENLRMLCPNCHSQTPTFAGRNLKRGTVVASP